MTINRIDHVGVYVEDMPSAVAHLSAMGFVITPPSGSLLASAVPGGPKLPIGTINRVAVLGDSFLEIVTTDDPQAEAVGPEPWRVRPRGPWPSGPCIVGLGTSDVAAQDSEWRQRGVRTAGVVQFQAAMKAVTSGVSEAEVSIVARDTTPEGLVLSVEFPPGNRRSPADRAHANTAAALTAVYVTIDNIQTMRRYEKILGVSVEESAGGFVAPIPDSRTDSRVHLGSASQLATIVPGIRDDTPAPCLSAVGVGVRDLGAAAAHLRSSGVPYTETGGRLVVAEASANLVIALEQLDG